MPKKKKVLLIEPNYANKFPPVGLMKIATYYKRKSWEVIFFKGDLKVLVAESIADNLIKQLNEIDSKSVDWLYSKSALVEYILTKNKDALQHSPLKNSDVSFLLETLIDDARQIYVNKSWKKEWDRVGITTLFTFYWNITIDTINFAKNYLVKDPKNLMIGGVLASIQPDEIEKATGIRPHIGILKPGDLGFDDNIKIDELPLDYSILDEIDYQYPMANAYYRYTTRGCVNHCAFCAVSTLEPEYQSYIPLKDSINKVNEFYGEQKDLLLMDNNVLASEHFEQIIQEIKLCGFWKGAKFKQQNLLKLAIENLNKGINDRAYIKKASRLMNSFYNTLKGEESYFVYKTLEANHLLQTVYAKKKDVLRAYNEIGDLYAKYNDIKSDGKLRIVDFNQGLDARLFTQEKANLLGQICIKPVRIAFDDIKLAKKYTEAIKMCVTAGIKDFSNYLLYNFMDKPKDLYERLKINIDLCDELRVSIYSFPMKFHPIRKTSDMSEDFSHNRDFIGKYWNRKYIRAIQAILNSTKGKVGRGTSFFKKAFGKDLNEFEELLEMPETMLIYRFFFEWLGSSEAKKIAAKQFKNTLVCNNSTIAWKTSFLECKNNLSNTEWERILDIIHKNNFENISLKEFPEEVKKLLNFYVNHKQAVIDENTDLKFMKSEYDKNPTIKLKRH